MPKKTTSAVEDLRNRLLDRVRSTFAEQGATFGDVADASGMVETDVKAILHDTKKPKLDQLVLMAHALGVKITVG